MTTTRDRPPASSSGGELVARGAPLTCFGGWSAAREFTSTNHNSDCFEMGAVVSGVGRLGMAVGCGAVVTARPSASRRALAVAVEALACLTTGLGAAARALLG